MPRPNPHDYTSCYRYTGPSFPYPTAHTRWDLNRDQRHNQSTSTQVERQRTSFSLPAQERFMASQDLPRWASHPLTQQTFTGGQLYQPTGNLGTPHDPAPSTGSAASVANGAFTSNITREMPNSPYQPPRPLPHFTPLASSPAHRSYQSSTDAGNLDRSEPVRDGRSNYHSCRWGSDNTPCLSRVTGSRHGIENHLRAYHRVRDNVRTVVCLWEGCTRTRPLRRENLARHVMTHMNIKWECPGCKKLFTRSDAVRRHLERVCDAT